jgi:hypothetical protein
MWFKKMTANELPSQTKEKYASLIHTHSGQRTLHRRRLGRPAARHRNHRSDFALTAGRSAADFARTANKRMWYPLLPSRLTANNNQPQN